MRKTQGTWLEICDEIILEERRKWIVAVIVAFSIGVTLGTFLTPLLEGKL